MTLAARLDGLKSADEFLRVGPCVVTLPGGLPACCGWINKGCRAAERGKWRPGSGNPPDKLARCIAGCDHCKPDAVGEALVNCPGGLVMKVDNQVASEAQTPCQYKITSVFRPENYQGAYRGKAH